MKQTCLKFHLQSPSIFLIILLWLYVANNNNPQLDKMEHPIRTLFFFFFKQRDVKDPFWPFRKAAFKKRSEVQGRVDLEDGTAVYKKPRAVHRTAVHTTLLIR